MKGNLPSIIKVFIEAFREWIRDQATLIAASMAYFQFLSFAPLIGYLIFISNKFFGHQKTTEEMLPVLKAWFSPQFVKVVIFFLARAGKNSIDDLYTLSIISGLALAYATKNFFEVIKNAVEYSWNKRREQSGFKGFLDRFFSDLKVMIGGIFIITVWILIRSALPHYFLDQPDDSFYLNFSAVVEMIFEFIVLFTLFLFFFSSIPPIKFKWKLALPGAAVGAFLQVIGRLIMKFEMYKYPNADEAESLIVVLIWFYYSGLVFVYAAEFSKVYISRKLGINVQELKYD